MASPYYNAGYPVVVQGQPVASNAGGYGGNASMYNQQSAPPQYNNNGFSGMVGSSFLEVEGSNGQPWNKGSPQPKRCRDVFWAILFYAHIGFIMCLAVVYTPAMTAQLASGSSSSSSSSGRQRFLLYDNNSNGNPSSNILLQMTSEVWKWCSIQFQDMPSSFHRVLQEQYGSSSSSDVNFDVNAIMLVLSICGLLALVLSSVALVMIMNFASGLIKAALIFHVVFMAVLAALALLSGSTGLAILLCIGAAFSFCFAVGAWSRIPFGAANLTTAVTAVRANIGLAFFAYLSLVMSFLWSIVWSLASVSTMFVVAGCDSKFQCSNQSPAVSVGLFLFFLSYHWTAQVIFNVVHVTTAGTVGTWWFAPHEANSCCSKAVQDSYTRAMTYSFGSICLGSLLVAIIEAARDLLRHAREQDDNLVACLADCCLGIIESWAEYFCKWAYVYVGLYGYGFIEAGSNVMSLFRTRGWTTIITDTLVDTVLFMVALTVGALTGIVGLIIGAGVDSSGDGTVPGVSFVIGFVVGWVMCASLFSIVASAVSTVIVCYAEAPNEFQANHPHLSNHMRAAWQQAWPVEFHY